MNSLLDGAFRIWLVGNHKHRAYVVGWVQLAVVLPCFVVGASANAADERAELTDRGIVADKCFSEKRACIGPVGFGSVEPGPVQESERWIKDGAEVVGGGGQSVNAVVAPNKVSPEAGQQNGTGYLPELFYKNAADFFQGVLWGLLPCGIIWMGTQKPNE